MDYLNKELAIALVKSAVTPEEIMTILRNDDTKVIPMQNNLVLTIANIYQTMRVEVRVDQAGRETRRTSLRVISDLGIDVGALEPRR